MAYNVALIIPYDADNRFLLQHRTADAKLLPGHWAFFGGGLEPGETPFDAVRREAMEEINFEIEKPELALEQDFQEGLTKGHLFIFIEQFTGNKNKLKLSEGQNWGWFNQKEVAGLKMIPRDREIINKISKRLQNAITEY